MSQNQREKRLEHELRLMQRAQQESSILSFSTNGRPASHYFIHLFGETTHQDYLNEHEVEIWLGLGYPNEPPEVRFTTPIFHPNVSRSGRVTLERCGIVWTSDMTVEQVCERLWDIARYAYLDATHIENASADAWFKRQREIPLPVDGRRLCDKREIEWGEVQTRDPTPPQISDDGITFLDP